MGHQTVGHSGSKGRLDPTFRYSSSSVGNTDPPSEIFSLFRPGVSAFCLSRRLVVGGAIEPASSEPSFYSRLFITTTVTGGWRPVIDLFRLNRFVQLSHFHMETAHLVLQSLRPGDWMISIDLQDAYIQVPGHPDFRRYLRFCIGEKTFQFWVLCFVLLICSTSLHAS